MASARSVALAALICLGQAAVAQTTDPAAMTEDKGHVYRWNKFTDDLYALHREQIAGREVRTEEELGGYAGRPGFYREERFFDADSGRLLSVIQWEAEQPDVIHSIAVYRHDDQGRVRRDYSATYLPDYRNAPTQTLVFLHHYPAGVHAFRSFDASNEVLLERCQGEIGGEPVFISLDIDEIEEARGERHSEQSGIMTTDAYRHCFSGLPETAAAALPPR